MTAHEKLLNDHLNDLAFASRSLASASAFLTSPGQSHSESLRAAKNDSGSTFTSIATALIPPSTPSLLRSHPSGMMNSHITPTASRAILRLTRCSSSVQSNPGELVNHQGIGSESLRLGAPAWSPSTNTLALYIRFSLQRGSPTTQASSQGCSDKAGRRLRQ